MGKFFRRNHLNGFHYRTLFKEAIDKFYNILIYVIFLSNIMSDCYVVYRAIHHSLKNVGE